MNRSRQCAPVRLELTRWDMAINARLEEWCERVSMAAELIR